MIMYLSSKRFSFILYYVPIEEELNNVSKNGKGLFSISKILKQSYVPQFRVCVRSGVAVNYNFSLNHNQRFKKLYYLFVD